MSEIIATHAVILLEVADDGLDGCTPSHVAFDLRGDAALLAGGVDFELVFGRRVVATVSGIGDDAIERVADDRLHGGDDGGERVAVIRIAGRRRDVGDELAAARVAQRRRHAHLHAELIGLVCLSLADAFHLGCVQAVNLAAALMAVLRQHALGQVQRPHEGFP